LSAWTSGRERTYASAAAASRWTTDFSRHVLDYSEIFSGGVPRDGIPPIYDPKFVSVGEADGWIDDVEPVIALEVGGVARRIHCRY